MSKTASFEDFCQYLISKKDDPDVDLDILVDFYIEFLEPFAEDNDISIPEELEEVVNAIFEEDDTSTDDDKDEDDDGNGDDEEKKE